MKINSSIYKSPVAKSTPFDNSTNGFTATDVQAAIEEAKAASSNTASPGFTYGRSGSVPAGTYLLNESVPSNTSGRLIFLNGASILKVFCANQDATVLTIDICSHDGDGINMTVLGTLTTAAQRGNEFNVNYPVALNKQIAIRLNSGSNSGKNLVVGILMQGSV